MAVYTKLSDCEIAEIAELFSLGIPHKWWEIEQGIENSNFGLVTNKGKWIITLTEKRVSPDDMPYYMELLLCLSSKGLPVPQPQKTKNGGFWQIYKNKPTCVVTFLNGSQLEKLSAEHSFMAGKFLAQMHLASENYTMHRANAMGIVNLGKLASKLNEHDLDKINVDGSTIEINSINSSIGKRIAQALNRINGFQDAEKLPKGQIHGDLFPDNVLFENVKLTGVIDFFFSASDTLQIDIATLINAWSFSVSGDYDKDITIAVLEGYQSVRKLSQLEITALPIYLLATCLRFYLTRLYDFTRTPADALVKPKDPEQYQRMLEYHMAQNNHCDYGILANK